MADKTASVRRIKEQGQRDATLLENGVIRVVVTDQGGMVPELSAKVGAGYLNAHWNPDFRANSGDEYDPAQHESFWKAKLLYHLAGNFPCAPNFGGGPAKAKVEYPPHGWTANERWQLTGTGTDAQSGAAWVRSTMESRDPDLPLSFVKIDAVLPGQPVQYSSLRVENRGSAAADINVAWHNTVGSPFLQAGCRMSASAETWATPPLGGEFDDTGRLAIGAQFASLAAAPLRSGKTADLTVVPGPLGYSDFVTGPVPAAALLGWSAVTNPVLGLAYVCFFPGPAGAAADDIVLGFNDFWMQYGGRPFTPWAAYAGGTDLTYCLGTENAVGAYSAGLELSRTQKKLLGSATTVTIPAGQARTLRYGTLFAAYEGGTLDQGVSAVQAEGRRLACTGSKETAAFDADGDFRTLKQLEGSMR